MTAEQQASELITEFYEVTESGLTYEDGCDRATACAIIHVEGIITVLDEFGLTNNDSEIIYWQSVLSILKSK